MALPQISLAVVGADYPNKSGPGRRFEIAMCSRGEPIDLRPEPRNPADPRAIAVYSARGVQMGYLTAERAPRIGQIIRSGTEVRAHFQETARFGAIIRAAFDGDEPQLPEPKEAGEGDEDPEFWPDEEWPDDGAQI